MGGLVSARVATYCALGVAACLRAGYQHVILEQASDDGEPAWRFTVGKGPRARAIEGLYLLVRESDMNDAPGSFIERALARLP